MLDLSELTALLTSMRERRGMGNGAAGGFGGPGGPQRGGFGDRAREGGQNRMKRRPGNDTENAQPGGELPQRPDFS